MSNTTNLECRVKSACYGLISSHLESKKKSSQLNPKNNGPHGRLAAAVSPAAGAFASGAAAENSGGEPPPSWYITNRPAAHAGGGSAKPEKTIQNKDFLSVSESAKLVAVPKSVDESDAALKDRFRMLNHAADILPEFRVGNCRRSLIDRKTPVSIVNRCSGCGDNLSSKYALSGVQNCGSIHVCPFCAPYIASVRQKELAHVVDVAAKKNLLVFMLTTTVRHDKDMSFQYLMDKIFGVSDGDSKKSRKRGGVLSRFMNCRAFRKLKEDLGVVGWVRVFETTYGDNGFHPHFHWMLLIDPLKLRCLDQAGLYHLWNKACIDSGLPSPSVKNGVKLDQADDGKAVAQYVAKYGTWSIDKELALSHLKKGRFGGRSQWQLLFDSLNGDTEATEAWLQIARGTFGLRSLVWSRGLKKDFGIDEISDQIIADAPAVVESVVYKFVDRPLYVDDSGGEVYATSKQIWNLVLGRGSRFDLLKAAQLAGYLGVVSYINNLISDYMDISLSPSGSSYRPLPSSPRVTGRSSFRYHDPNTLRFG